MGADIIARGKQGEKHYKAKLTEEQVVRIRHLYWTVGLCGHCISKLMDIPRSRLWEAAVGYTWGHLPMPQNNRTGRGKIKHG